MTEKERLAFENAYMANVSSCSRERLSAFMDIYMDLNKRDGGNFTEDEYYKFSDIYGSVMDAIGMWDSARRFQINLIGETA